MNIINLSLKNIGWRALAERRGFEPRNQLPSYYLSKVAQSTTLPSLRINAVAFYMN